MEHPLQLQDPTSNQPTYLFEAIVAAARRATSARAAFAFASLDGVEALLDDPTIVSFLKRGKLELVVGVDAITNRAALQRLAAYSSAHASLSVRVFWNKTRRLFHPKLCYFTGAKRATLIVGSGNLTTGGLHSNHEAFTVAKLSSIEAAAVGETLDTWFAAHQPDLRQIDDEVLARADKNRIRRTPGAEPDDEDEGIDEPPPVPQVGRQVLVAEVPKSGDRWNQVNFDLKTIRRYFKAKPGSSQRVYLLDRTPGHHFGERETRPCVDSGPSQNYRSELAAGRGRVYPKKKRRPIAVFLRTAPRTFRYALLLPGDDGYDQMAVVLSRVPRTDQMRRPLITIEALTRAWPDNTLLA